MKIVLQRVKRASVTIFPPGDEPYLAGSIENGLALLVGFKPGDSVESISRLAKKTIDLRIFEDDAGKMNRSIEEAGGSLLVVSQFTLYGDTRKGRRPSFTGSMAPAEAEQMYHRFIKLLQNSGLPVATGVFGAKMDVEIINDGPVTFILDDDMP